NASWNAASGKSSGAGRPPANEMISGRLVILRISRIVERCMRSTRLAKADLLTVVNVPGDLRQLFGAEHFLAQGEKLLFFDVEMREKHIHHIGEAAAPVRVSPILPQTDL